MFLGVLLVMGDQPYMLVIKHILSILPGKKNLKNYKENYSFPVRKLTTLSFKEVPLLFSTLLEVPNEKKKKPGGLVING